MPVRRPGRRRPSLSHILIGLAVALAFGLNFLALQDRGAVVLVALVPDGLAEGAVFDATSVEFAEAPADMTGVDGLVAEDDLSIFDGWITTRALPPGSLVDRASLVSPVSQNGKRLMSIPIPVEHAAGASIAVGDTVDVVSVVEGEARFVASGLRVVDVAVRNEGALASTGGYYVVVETSPAQILDIAASIDSGSIDLIRSTGAPPIGAGG